MKRKIYGAPGQLECKLIITNGLFRAEVHFRGGSIADQSRRPATYATSRFLEQDIIENSEEFKRGKIVLMHEVEVPDDAEEMARKASMGEVNKEPRPSEEETSGVQSSEVSDDVDAGEQLVEVPDKSEAIEWLKEHNAEAGYTAAKLRSAAAFAAACAENGVRFIFTAE